jgi:hypothetical protein
MSENRCGSESATGGEEEVIKSFTRANRRSIEITVRVQ